MLTVHHLANSQSSRIIWLLEELNTPYQLKIYNRDKKTMLAPIEYKSLHPSGTAPIITGENITLAETNAIIDYILDQHPNSNLRPDINSPSRTAYLYWSHAALGSVTPMMILLFVFKIMRDKSPVLLRPITKKLTEKTADAFPMPRLQALLVYANDTLANSSHLAGEHFTAADIAMEYNFQGLDSRMALFNITKEFKHIARYLERIQSRDAYQAALKKSGDQ